VDAKLAGKRRRSWRDLSSTQKALVVLGGAAEAVVTAVAARDLATRDPAQVRGPKAAWVPLLVVQPFGPVAYLFFGRQPP
jgi:Phospholipase_D-nuclease N-terminal